MYTYNIYIHIPLYPHEFVTLNPKHIEPYPLRLCLPSNRTVLGPTPSPFTPQRPSNENRDPTWLRGNTNGPRDVYIYIFI